MDLVGHYGDDVAHLRSLLHLQLLPGILHTSLQLPQKTVGGHLELQLLLGRSRESCSSLAYRSP